MNDRKVIKAEDQKYEDHIIDKVVAHKDGWEITHDKCLVFFCPKPSPVVPKVGSRARFYGDGFGRPVRGLDIDGQEVFYRTEAEDKDRHRQYVKDEERKKFDEFQRNKAGMDKRVAALPKVFRDRIQKFRDTNPDFRWEFEGYELFTCEEAVKIAAYCKTKEAVRTFHDDSAEQKKAGISDQHSGNTFGMACRLAMWYVSQPEQVAKEHGALVALVGCEDYGCPHEPSKG